MRHQNIDKVEDFFPLSLTNKRRVSNSFKWRIGRFIRSGSTQIISLMSLVTVLTGLTLLNSQAFAKDDPLAAIDLLIAQQPKHLGAMHHGARIASRRGELDRALAYLDKLERAGFDDVFEMTDFVALHGRPQFQALAARLQSRAPEVGKAQLFAETRCADLLPEGIAHDPRRQELLISSGHQRCVFAIDSKGNCRNLVSDEDSGLLSVLGMKVDVTTDTLWVANSHAPFMKNFSDKSSGKSQLSQIDLASGKVISHYALPPNGLANDLTIRPNGEVLVTESISGAIYRLAKNSKELEVFLAPQSFEGPNGILSLVNGDVIVADFHGLHLVQEKAGKAATVSRLQIPGERYLGGIDGLASDGKSIIAIQNLVGRGRVWNFEIDTQKIRVDNLKLLLRNHADFFNPTTGVIANNHFYFVADPQLQQNDTPQLKALPSGRQGHRILQIPLQGIMEGKAPKPPM